MMQTEHAIKLVKDTFQQELSSALRLRRVTAPLFVESGHGLNDDLTGVEKPITFFVPELNRTCEIVHSLAKWKRMKLWRIAAQPGYGIYTDMNAIRTFETPDDIHSLYVDQWDWEKVLTASDRTREYLRATVRDIFKVLKNVEYVVCERYPELKPFLPDAITFIDSEELFQRYPNLSAKERENAICQQFGAVFIEGIGAPLSNGQPHDSRAADYDDWSLNGEEGGTGYPQPWFLVYTDKQDAVSGVYNVARNNLDLESTYLNTNGTQAGCIMATDGELRLQFDGFHEEYFEQGYAYPYYTGSFRLVCTDGKTYVGKFMEQFCNSYNFSTYGSGIRDHHGMWDEDGQQGIETIQVPETGTHKILHEGQLYIIRDSVIYNVSGLRVR